MSLSASSSRAFESGLFPDDLPGFPIQSDYFELVLSIGANAVWMNELFVIDQVHRCLCTRNYVTFNGGSYKYAIAPNNR